MVFLPAGVRRQNDLNSYPRWVSCTLAGNSHLSMIFLPIKAFLGSLPTPVLGLTALVTAGMAARAKA